MNNHIESPDLGGKVLLITGGARRVGAEIVRTLHGAGASILLHYRTSAAEAGELAAELNAQRRGSVALHAADLGEEGHVRRGGRRDVHGSREVRCRCCRRRVSSAAAPARAVRRKAVGETIPEAVEEHDAAWRLRILSPSLRCP